MARPNVELVCDAYAAFQARDVAKIFALFDPEVEVVQSSEIPYGGHYRGHAGAGEFFGKLTSTITSVVTLERLIDAGESVVAIGRTRGTVNATGAPFDVPVAHVWTFRDGHATRVAFYIDNPTMRAALGG